MIRCSFLTYLQRRAMLLPLFDKDCDLVGWILPGEHIFDTQLNWLAFITDGHAWSSVSGNWLGPVHDLLCLDGFGHPIAWNPANRVAGIGRPPRPPRAPKAPRPPRPASPPKPPRPARPATPVGGWSQFGFPAWAAQ
ncbi:4-fold beta flower protein [Stutzerimonas kunmingensis]|uniref:4-fold beta flower protein n=1 Tax=Stutzerimonas kunmingensis TaxID=1211807 RepID=UPI0035E455AF